MGRRVINQAELKERLDYCPETGVFTRRTNSGRWKVGQRAGAINAAGYVTISIDGKAYYGHRLAWLWVNGEAPRHEVDHIDGNPTNNRIFNLREATSSQNSQNTRRRSDNTHGKGVVFHHHKRKPYQARIGLNGSTRSLGYFPTAEEARRAYQDAAASFFGEFANYGAAAANDNGPKRKAA